MLTKLVTANVWSRITRAAKASPSKAHVAVAYFGSGASRLLPLRRGSLLVVDMSQKAVASGQTKPSEVLALVEAGVEVYSREALHAKVYVLGIRTFIGSPNVSQNSAKYLVEVMTETNDPNLAAAACRFVRQQCHRPVTTEYARQMERFYRPPKFEGRMGHRKGVGAGVEALRVVNLVPATYSEKEERINDSGVETAARKLEHPRSSVVEYFRWSRKGNFKRHELVIRLFKENQRRVWVCPPGNIVDIKQYKVNGSARAFIYIEVPKTARRRSLEAVRRRLGGKAVQRLRHGGKVGDANLRSRLFKMWAGK